VIKVAGPAGGEGVGMNPKNKKRYRHGTLQNVDHNATVSAEGKHSQSQLNFLSALWLATCFGFWKSRHQAYM